ncbi:hypothetical protein K3152_01440 [Qipengyuania sp. 1NDH17]|uniref:Secreted protein n=1 Tax=Qipengyuania polymorpha TaxID=2867234 RepID=A0ABS7IX91_9SPHN|nr:hypothetical protein [Qipengyuania polymorpha]MBX7456900.1 hypothetical protein [Qipengyuania polymorpha]
MKHVLAAIPIVLASTTPVSLAAADAPYFGDDSYEHAKDGECDDIRFTGEGMAEHLLTEAIGRDASDCRAAWVDGTIERNPWFNEPAPGEDYDYGDDRSGFANDGQCDDIRFVGAHTASLPYLTGDIGHDASDCRAGIEDGSLTWQANARDFKLGVTVTD